MAPSHRFERIVQYLAKVMILCTTAGAAYTLWRGANPWTVTTVWIALNALNSVSGAQRRPSDRRPGKAMVSNRVAPEREIGLAYHVRPRKGVHPVDKGNSFRSAQTRIDGNHAATSSERIVRVWLTSQG